MSKVHWTSRYLFFDWSIPTCLLSLQWSLLSAMSQVYVTGQWSVASNFRKMPAEGKVFRLAEVKEHNISKGETKTIWVVIHDKVYDITKFLDEVCSISGLFSFSQLFVAASWRRGDLNRERWCRFHRKFRGEAQLLQSRDCINKTLNIHSGCWSLQWCERDAGGILHRRAPSWRQDWLHWQGSKVLGSQPGSRGGGEVRDISLVWGKLKVESCQNVKPLFSLAFVCLTP